MMDQPKDDPRNERDEAVAPETYNDEQEDESTQAQTLSEQARKRQPDEDRPTESRKAHDENILDSSEQDLVDHMKDMEQSGRIDMDAYRGEDNLDDNEDKYGKSKKVDDLPSDGS